MSVVSDSAVCRNLRDWIPSAGTLCAAKHHVPDSQSCRQQEDTGRKDAKDVDEKGGGGGAHIQLVVDIGSILQQSVHHLGVSVL